MNVTAIVPSYPVANPPHRAIASWTVGVPALTLALESTHLFGTHGLAYSLLLGVALVPCVFAAVHHAEILAHRLGEPFGTVLLALSVTGIEIALIGSLMVSGGTSAASLARDTVFATVMIILNGLVGASLVVGGRRYVEQSFSVDAVGGSLAALAALTALTLVLPNYTTTIAGPYYSKSQLAFVACVALSLYGTFLFVQTVRHRHYFVGSINAAERRDPGSRPGSVATAISAILLPIALAAVVLDAESLAPGVEAAVAFAGAPKGLVAIVVATMVLMPEGYSALRAAARNHLQASLNLTLGSALASIGLTIPAMSVLALVLGAPLTLGLNQKEMVLLILSFFVATVSLGTGRTTILQGMVHLVIFAVYLFTAVVP